MTLGRVERYTLVSGARDRAMVSFKLKHIDLENELIEHDARDVRTKRAKTFTSWFFPVGQDIRKIVVDWVARLREQKGFEPEDPLFPKSKGLVGESLRRREILRLRATEKTPSIRPPHC
jgi:hypothetical protein